MPSAALTRLLARFAHSLARETVNDWTAVLSVFFCIFDHSARGTCLRVGGLPVNPLVKGVVLDFVDASSGAQSIRVRLQKPVYQIRQLVRKMLGKLVVDRL